MEKTIKYVVMNLYTPPHGHYSCYDIHVYSQKSGNRDAIVKYCHKVRSQKGYKNNKNYKWYIVTEQQAREQESKLRAWKLEQERKDLERRFPVRYVGQTAREEMAEMMTRR
jgi:hypothetical protein